MRPSGLKTWIVVSLAWPSKVSFGHPLYIPDDHVIAVIPGGERSSVGAEGSNAEAGVLANQTRCLHPGRRPGERPHAPRAKIEQAKAPLHVLEGEGAPVGAHSVRQRPDGVAADHPQCLRVYGVRRPVAGDQQAPVRARQRRRAGGARRDSDGSRAAWRPGHRSGTSMPRRPVDVPPGVGDDQGAPVRVVVGRFEEAQPGAGWMVAQRGRAPDARRIGVQNFDVAGQEVDTGASGDSERVPPGSKARVQTTPGA